MPPERLNLKKKAAERKDQQMKKCKVPVSCNKDCGGGCPLLAHVEDGRLVKITDNPLGTRYMTGCVRGFQMPRVVYHRDRLKQPLLLKRREGFRRI